jgi:hypothetical protein
VIVENFQHRHAGHCETGVTSALLTHYGLPLSEPMALGLSGSLVFVHLPMVKIGGFPLTAYRMMPGSVYSGLKGALGLTMERRRYGDAPSAMADLDRELAAGRPVGLQTSVFWLSYFPPDMRFHFNAHNLIVYGKDGDEYLISDPVFDQPQRCASADLAKARFARGAFAPHGLMYRPRAFDRGFDLARAVRRGIRRTWMMMLYTPLPFVGVRAIRGLAKSIENLPRKNADVRYQRLYVGNIVRMQEEIGTGGGGFRFMYAAFLQEAGEALGSALLKDAAREMTATGDAWREFALAGAQFSRQKNDVDCAQLATRLRACAAREEQVYRMLKAY